VWIACQDGSIAICDINTRSITEYRSFGDLVKHGQLLKCMQAINDNIVVLAYYHNVLAFVKNSESQPAAFEQPSSLLRSIDQLMSTDHTSSSLVVTRNLEGIGCLNTIEIVDDHQQLVWCGCDKGTIYIVTATNWEEIFQYNGSSSIKTNALKVNSVSDKLGTEDNIVQLKSVLDLTLEKKVVYAVHENSEQKSFVITCWLTDRTLQRVISLDEQGKVEILLITHNLTGFYSQHSFYYFSMV